MNHVESRRLLSDDLRMAGTQESTMYFHLAPEVIVKEQKEREVLLENEDVRLILGSVFEASTQYGGRML